MAFIERLSFYVVCIIACLTDRAERRVSVPQCDS